MENSIKAMYIGAGMLIAVLVIGVFVYMFRSAATFGESYEEDQALRQVQAFNAQFEMYQKETEQENSYFESIGNVVSDVISCANLACDINQKNDYDLQNQLQVIVKDGTKKYYIYPFKVQPKSSFIENLSFDIVKEMDEKNEKIQDDKCLTFNDFLNKYNNHRITFNSGTSHDFDHGIVYEYYFDVGAQDIIYSEVTGKVNSITFNVKKTQYFEEDEYFWYDIGL